jgi:hypothetical protein
MSGIQTFMIYMPIKALGYLELIRGGLRKYEDLGDTRSSLVQESADTRLDLRRLLGDRLKEMELLWIFERQLRKVAGRCGI